MANANTFAGFQNLPGVAWTNGSTETGYVIPAAGVYPGLPSPSQVAANWLVLPALPGDVSTTGVLDLGRPFRVRVNGEIKSAQSENVTIKLYHCTAAKFLAGVTATTAGTAIASSGAIATGAALKFNFYLDAILQWDAQSGALNGTFTGHNAGSTPAIVALTTITSQVTALTENDLNFFFTVTTGTGTNDVIGPLDFTIDRY